MRRGPVRDAVLWSVLSLAGCVGLAAAVALEVPFGTASAPFVGEFRWKLVVGTALAPLVACVVLAAVASDVHLRLRWRWLLPLSWVAAVAWTAALASVDGGYGFSRPFESGEYLPDVEALAAGPGDFLEEFTERSASWTDATRTHPPGPVLLLWALTRAGLARPTSLGVAVTVLGCLAVPLVAVAVRDLVSDRAARLLLPVLVLAPWAVWVAVSMEAVVAALGAAHVAAAVAAASRRGRPAVLLAVLAGALLGVAALFSYSVAWLGVAGIGVFFTRRRPVLVLLAGLAALVPLLLLDALGFSWFDGLTAAQADFSTRVEPVRPWQPWVAADAVVLLLACGPALVTSLRAGRRSPALPLLLGGGAAVVFAVAAGLARGEVERTWLPFFPWLLAAVGTDLPPGRAATGGVVLLAGLGAVVAVVLQTLLRTAW